MEDHQPAEESRPEDTFFENLDKNLPYIQSSR